MYEHKRQPLATRRTFYIRVGRNFAVSFLLVALWLLIGTVGFRMSAGPAYDWMDCFHNASMLLSGMGPVITEFDSNGGKLFSALYALFSGVAFITNIGILLAPAAHRFFHKLHLEES
ncbi:MAG: hypothetical protein MUF29_01690 [Chitinophagaceae bacterium]|jgi:hypothetical protein|nr:hypothetical protein [Chitinophagaceae bacterium]